MRVSVCVYAFIITVIIIIIFIIIIIINTLINSLCCIRLWQVNNQSKY